MKFGQLAYISKTNKNIKIVERIYFHKQNSLINEYIVYYCLLEKRSLQIIEFQTFLPRKYQLKKSKKIYDNVLCFFFKSGQNLINLLF